MCFFVFNQFVLVFQLLPSVSCERKLTWLAVHIYRLSYHVLNERIPVELTLQVEIRQAVFRRLPTCNRQLECNLNIFFCIT
jgi:hypothetical protein